MSLTGCFHRLRVELCAQWHYGHSLHMELWHHAREGIPPSGILRTVTSEAATAVGAGDVLGTLSPGKLADIVLLDKNPLDDVSHTLGIWQFIQGRRVFARQPEVATR